MAWGQGADSSPPQAEAKLKLAPQAAQAPRSAEGGGRAPLTVKIELPQAKADGVDLEKRMDMTQARGQVPMAVWRSDRATQRAYRRAAHLQALRGLLP